MNFVYTMRLCRNYAGLGEKEKALSENNKAIESKLFTFE